jgi:hypothetical protein
MIYLMEIFTCAKTDPDIVSPTIGIPMCKVIWAFRKFNTYETQEDKMRGSKTETNQQRRLRLPE